MNISIIVPHFNESGNLIILTKRISKLVKNCRYEIIFINDGSTVSYSQEYHNIKKIHNDVTFIKHNKNLGQSLSIRTGIQNAKYDNILTMDADNQNNPEDIDRLIKFYNDNSLDIICGQRVKRNDKFSKRIASKIANAIRKFLLDDKCDDTGCSLKLFKKKFYEKIPFFINNHRYFPALFIREGCKIDFINVSHNERLLGKSKYNNFKRFFEGVFDLIGVIWLLRRSKKVIIQNED